MDADVITCDHINVKYKNMVAVLGTSGLDKKVLHAKRVRSPSFYTIPTTLLRIRGTDSIFGLDGTEGGLRLSQGAIVSVHIVL